MKFIGNIKGMHSTQPGNICTCLYIDTGRRVDFKYENTLNRLNEDQLLVFKMILQDREWNINRLGGDIRLAIGRLIELGLVALIGDKIKIHSNVIWSPSEKYKHKHQGAYKTEKDSNLKGW